MARSVVGQPLSRVDGPLKVTGRATYAAEHPIPGLVHGVLVGATICRGTVASIDTRTALAHPGVLRILTDFSAVHLPYDARRVNFWGQPIAVVLATTLEQAEHAASLLAVDYTSTAHLTNIDAPTAAPGPAPNTPDYSRGNADAALRAAPHSVDLTFSVVRHNHNPMELASTIASWADNQLTLWTRRSGWQAPSERWPQHSAFRDHGPGDLAVRRWSVRQPRPYLATPDARRVRRAGDGAARSSWC